MLSSPSGSGSMCFAWLLGLSSNNLFRQRWENCLDDCVADYPDNIGKIIISNTNGHLLFGIWSQISMDVV